MEGVIKTIVAAKGRVTCFVIDLTKRFVVAIEKMMCTSVAPKMLNKELNMIKIR